MTRAREFAIGLLCVTIGFALPAQTNADVAAEDCSHGPSQNPGGKGWDAPANNTPIYFDIVRQENSSSAGMVGDEIVKVEAAFATWNTANELNCSGLVFTERPSPVPTAHIIVSKNNGTAPGADYASASTDPDYAGGRFVHAEIVYWWGGFNASPLVYAWHRPEGVPPTNPTLKKYLAAVHARGIHEIGHTMGLDHPGSHSAGKSCMNIWNAAPTPSTNNSANPKWQPANVQSCDNTEVRLYNLYRHCSRAWVPPTGTNRVCWETIAFLPCPPGTTFLPPEAPGSTPGSGNCCYASPIIIDLDGDAFNLTDEAGGVSFDIGVDGNADSVSWTDATADDAWLALDRDGSGTIDSGSELFGNFTKQSDIDDENGFNALAWFDDVKRGGNEDGKINDLDPIYDFLRLWRDTNHNGISESSELFTLQSLNVVAISLSYSEWRHSDPNGNYFKYIGAAIVNNNGTPVTKVAADVYLITNGGPPSGGYGKMLGDVPEVTRDVDRFAIPQIVADRSLGVTSGASRTRLHLRR